MRKYLLAVTTCATAVWAGTGVAHSPDYSADGPALLHVREHPKHGNHLVDDHGISLYLFEIDVQGSEGKKAQSNCYDRCAVAWPPLLTEGQPEVHDDVQSALIGTIE